MSKEPTQPRKPFGERDDDERSLPFGASRRRRGADPVPPPLPDDENVIHVPLVRVRPPEPEPDAAEDWLEDDDTDEAQFARAYAGGPPLVREDPALLPTDEPDDAAQPAERGVSPLRLRVLLRTMGIVFGSAFLVATMFTWWTPNAFIPPESISQLSVALATQSSFNAVPLPPSPTAPATVVGAVVNRNIGIVSGHRGVNPSSGEADPGAVCEDGLAEAAINEDIANRVAERLRLAGYNVEVFDEFDPRLANYEALVMVSIHADSCEYVNDDATGFKVASFYESTTPNQDNALVRCLIQEYIRATGMRFHPSVTFDMTDYHTFRELAPNTPGAIIEVGFLYLDRELLTNSPDRPAKGITDGILCYLNGGGQPPTPQPTANVPPVETPIP